MMTLKQFTSWGEAIQVKTKTKTYKEVIICTDPSNEGTHLLEYQNGDVIKVNTGELVSLKREHHDEYFTNF